MALTGVIILCSALLILVCLDHALAIASTSVRLADGPSQYVGRVEIYHSGSYGTVCDDDIDTNMAIMFCNMMGFNGGSVRGNTYGSGTGMIWVDNIYCPTGADDINDCSFTWGSHNCQHSEDVSVECAPNNPYYPNEINGLRLVDGSGTVLPWGTLDGYLQIQWVEDWGTVCDDSFSYSEAEFFCRALGFDRGTVGWSSSNSYITGTIWLDDVSCPTDAKSFSQCTHGGWGIHNCAHSEDVYLSCATDSYGQSYVPEPKALAMVSDGNDIYGPPHILLSGSYGWICDDGNFDDEVAKVICEKDFGYNDGQKYIYEGSLIPAMGIMTLNQVHCEGGESSLSDCNYNILNLNASSELSYNDCPAKALIKCTSALLNNATIIIIVVICVIILAAITIVVACSCYHCNKTNKTGPATQPGGASTLTVTQQTAVRPPMGAYNGQQPMTSPGICFARKCSSSPLLQ
ncbi:hypothetical protein CAPTEDRAFT_221427 [Capitella teleta]|uniref:SRCR domain-containing protein n=1 Tax=Capitella teleta TaxID=283909 RepID=R7UV86_CAPTE|nr:hypothetical protein CAPTEDRAFT_221427 [Capitella teleta]|eukprot:ELU10060.1 hypothetical protein CAPTEDRAFT_221427 [Capitella teleta]